MRVRQRRAEARSRQRGIAALEFALISPILILLVFGTIQYGFYFWGMQAASGAAREGARRAAVGDLSCDELTDFVTARVGAAAVGSLTITRTFVEAGGASGAEVGGNVSVSLSFATRDLNLPYLPYPADGQVGETTQSRVENVTADSMTCS